MRSLKELSLDKKILALVNVLSPSGKATKAAEFLLGDSEIRAMQDYANTVSIKRLGYNDHGPVHMRTVALNTLRMMELFRKARIKTSLELEESGDFEDSLVAVLMAGFLHDVGMTMGRQDHEIHGSYLAAPLIDRLLQRIYPDNILLRVSVRSVALESISGHMGNRTIHSLEAGVILVADGCDMEKGRARIPIALASGPRVGDIHKYSANAITYVRISAGKEKPIRIDVSMSAEVGLFQVEEVLLGKIAASTAKGYIELYAEVTGKESKRYL
ncbi:MAG: phosphohydrolase [Spirochaetaceae bacterium]|jgi:metal-dependent HD superfamily phosphatase/phosphodiesterase|nr:phosphohydrolase [Spirochaetaceae bacterium]